MEHVESIRPDAQRERQARRSILTTCLAALFGFMGIGVVDPILPIIANQIGATHWQVEMLFTSYILMMSIIMVPSGILAARWGSKRILVSGLFLVAVFASACAMSSTIGQLMAFRAGWGMGNAMFFATSMSILIGLAPNLDQAMGYYEAALGMGMSFGPLLGGLLGQFGWRYPFFATSVLMLLAFVLTFLLVKDPGGQVRHRAGFGDFVSAITYRPFLLVGLAAMFYYYAFFTVLAYSPLLLKLDAISLGLIFFGWGVGLGIGSTKWAHGLMNRHSPMWVVRLGAVLMSAVLLLVLLSTNKVLTIVVIVLSGFVSGLNNAAYSTLAIETSQAQRSIASGAYNFIRWLGAAVAPVAAGFASSLFPTAPYAVALLCMLVCTGLLMSSTRTPVAS